MVLEVTVGPPRLSINQGHCVLITEQDGRIDWPTDKGLYVCDTRVLSSWALYADGQEWDLLNSANLAHCAAKIYLLNRPIVTAEAGDSRRRHRARDRPGDRRGAARGRRSAQLRAKPARFNLEIAMRSDFADLFEVKSQRVIRRGQRDNRLVGARGEAENGLCQSRLQTRTDCARSPVQDQAGLCQRPHKLRHRP